MFNKFRIFLVEFLQYFAKQRLHIYLRAASYNLQNLVVSSASRKVLHYAAGTMIKPFIIIYQVLLLFVTTCARRDTTDSPGFTVNLIVPE